MTSHGQLRICAPIHTGVATYPPGAEFGPRDLGDYELVWIIDGDAVYGAGDQTYQAPAGSLTLCRPGAPDYFLWDRTHRTRHGYVHFHIASIPASWPEISQWPVVRDLPADDVIRPMFRHLITWHDNQPAEQSELTIAAILTAFLGGNTAAGLVNRDIWPVALETVCTTIYQLLDKNPASQITLSELASIAAVSPEHLCRLFQAHVGHSPVETVRLIRLSYAATLLSRTNYTVGEVSELCGFANPYHFSRAFKRVYGISPSKAKDGHPLPLSPSLLLPSASLPRLKPRY